MFHVLSWAQVRAVNGGFSELSRPAPRSIHTDFELVPKVQVSIVAVFFRSLHTIDDEKPFGWAIEPGSIVLHSLAFDVRVFGYDCEPALTATRSTDPGPVRVFE